ncbi:MAG: hypothetical protein QOH75_155 [Actinomycetota bacterium]|nr:hypothetical protein [Actinomycetota bacterium]
MPSSWDETVVVDIDGTGTDKNGVYYPDRGVTRALVEYRSTGDLDGTRTAAYLFAYRDGKAGHARINGYERFEGSIGGHEGTCVFVHTGGVEDGLVSGHVEVAEGLGTGGLEDLSGSADLVLENPTDDGYELTLAYDL